MKNKKKIALVGSGRRSEDRKRKRSYTIWVSCGCFTLQIDRRRFTMGGVKKKSKSSPRCSWGSAPCTVSKFILSKSRSGVGSKKNWKNSGKIQELEVNTTRSTCEMKLIGQKWAKSERKSLKEMSLLLRSWWLILGLVHGKKTGCRRRIVIKEDLVAEDKSKLVSSRVGPSCR